MAEPAENKGFVWTTGKKVAAGVAALFMVVVLYLFVRKPAPATHAPGKPAKKGPLDTAAAAVQSITVDKDLKVYSGLTGPEVDYLQDAVGQEYSTNTSITATAPYVASGTWDTPSDAVIKTIYSARGQEYNFPDGISINDFETMMAAQPASA